MCRYNFDIIHISIVCSYSRSLNKDVNEKLAEADKNEKNDAIGTKGESTI
jgi:hypothetical protein